MKKNGWLPYMPFMTALAVTLAMFAASCESIKDGKSEYADKSDNTFYISEESPSHEDITYNTTDEASENTTSVTTTEATTVTTTTSAATTTAEATATETAATVATTTTEATTATTTTATTSATTTIATTTTVATTTSAATTTAITTAAKPSGVRYDLIPPEGNGAFQDGTAYEVLDYVNNERANYGLDPLTWDERYVVSAKIRATELKDSWSHTRPDGRKFYTAFTDTGEKYHYIGENLAYGKPIATYTPEAVVDSWMKSTMGHREAILNEKYELAGIACYDIDGVRYYALHFGTDW